MISDLSKTALSCLRVTSLLTALLKEQNSSNLSIFSKMSQSSEAGYLDHLVFQPVVLKCSRLAT